MSLIHYGWPVPVPNDVHKPFVYDRAFNEASFSGLVFVFMSAMMLIATLIGWSMILCRFGSLAAFKDFLRVSDAEFIFFLPVPFLIGYPIFVVIVRAITIFVPPYFGSIVAIIIMAALGALPVLAHLRRGNLPSIHIGALGMGAAFLVVITFLALLFQIQPFPHHHLTGDATRFYVEILEEISRGPGGFKNATVAMFGHHYDEFMFSIPTFALLDLVTNKWSPYEPFWMITGVSKAAAFCFLYVLFRHFGAKIWLTAVFTLLLFFGTYSANPLGMVLYSDSVTPLVSTLHIGRVITDVLIWLVFLLLLCPTDAPRVRWERIYLASCLFLYGAGISAITISNTSVLILFGAALAIAGLTRSYLVALKSESPASTHGDTARRLFAILMVTMIAVAFFSHIPTLNVTLRGYALLLAIVVAPVLVVAIYGLQSYSPAPNAGGGKPVEWKNLLLIAGGLVFGILILGSELLRRTLPMMQTITEFFGLENTGYHKPLLSREIFQGAFQVFVQSKEVAYSNSFGIFVNWYAMLFMVWFLPFFLRPVWTGTNASRSSILDTNRLMLFLLISAWAFLIGLFIVNFVFFGGTVRDWFKTRFTEPWLYSSLIVVFIMVAAVGSRLQRVLVGLFCVIWIAGPHYSKSYPILLQLEPNYKYLMKALGLG